MSAAGQDRGTCSSICCIARATQGRTVAAAWQVVAAGTWHRYTADAGRRLIPRADCVACDGVTT